MIHVSSSERITRRNTTGNIHYSCRYDTMP